VNGASHIILIDGNVRRRAAISHELSGRGIHVEPFETLAELSGHALRQELVLIEDADGALAALTAHMVREGKWLPVVAFAEAPAPRRIVDAILGGAIDYLVWPFDGTALNETLLRARDRAQNVGSAKMREAVARSLVDRLTSREREVLSGMTAGHSNRAIAEQLAISPRTVEIHRANMLQKIGATHTSEAIRIAIEASLAD
jgi:FixJ family two-component response regulator